jgi:hypothetical protein
MRKRSLSYKDLMSGKVDRAEIEKLAAADMLTDTTFARLAHLGRFLERVGKASPNPDLKIGDVLDETELQKFWQETAGEGADVGRCPLIH